MKNKLILLVTSLLVGVCVVALAQSGNTMKKIISSTFKTSGTYTWAQTTEYPSALTVDMTFRSGSYSNTFYFGYVRDGIQHDLLTYTASNMHTLVWYVPSRYFFQTGDQLVWSNSVAQWAVFTLNTDSQF